MQNTNTVGLSVSRKQRKQQTKVTIYHQTVF